jgi:hypothetical protein
MIKNLHDSTPLWGRGRSFLSNYSARRNLFAVSGFCPPRPVIEGLMLGCGVLAGQPLVWWPAGSRLALDFTGGRAMISGRNMPLGVVLPGAAATGAGVFLRDDPGLSLGTADWYQPDASAAEVANGNGNGYATHGQALSTPTVNKTSGVGIWDAVDPDWMESDSGITARRAIIVRDANGDATPANVSVAA